jgi:hypothetical protein
LAFALVWPIFSTADPFSGNQYQIAVSDLAVPNRAQKTRVLRFDIFSAQVDYPSADI